MRPKARFPPHFRAFRRIRQFRASKSTFPGQFSCFWSQRRPGCTRRSTSSFRPRPSAGQHAARASSCARRNLTVTLLFVCEYGGMVDALSSGGSERMLVGVQLPLLAPDFKLPETLDHQVSGSFEFRRQTVSPTDCPPAAKRYAAKPSLHPPHLSPSVNHLRSGKVRICGGW